MLLLMEENLKSAEKFGETLLSRLKLPILVTYLIVLIIYNWQIILYLLFKIAPIDEKIDYIVQKHHDSYIQNVLIPIIIAFVYTLLFPILQVGINLLFSWFKRINIKLNRQEELDDAIHKFRMQENLTGQQPLERLQNNIDLLSSENQKLINDNKNLLSRLKEENLKEKSENNFIKAISEKREKELDEISKKLLIQYKNLSSEEQSVFLDLINYFDSSEKSLPENSIENVSIYSEYSEIPLGIFKESNILKYYLTGSGRAYKTSTIGFEVLEYFKENFSDKL